ncbi:MAG: hypothetical protein LBN12_07135 [Clostridiales Family XIII bacterium]|jgi:hypothetical protein|nr:hypothetical protein [Clostridiales Family XIII bacterium]
MLIEKDIPVYRTKSSKISGRSYIDVERAARRHFKEIAQQSKRNPYIRSIYFQKDKIFLKIFWQHLMEKHEGDRKRRLKFYIAAIELLRYTTIDPDSRQNPNGRNEMVHRFAGETKDGE